MRRRAQPWLGTLVDISIPDIAETDFARLSAAAFTVIAEVQRDLSFHDAASELSCWNRLAAGACHRAGPHLAAVLQLAGLLFERSQGLFDASIAAQLVRHGFLPALPQTAMPPLMSLSDCGWRWLDAQTLQKTRAHWLDLGGIAKGYAVDCAISVLQQAGVQNAIVNAGGDARCLGTQTFYLRHPQQPEQIAYQLALSDQALATSAAYFSSRETAEGWRQPLVTPQGQLVKPDGRSVTVVANSAMVADALTKIVALSGDAQHPLLAEMQAQAFII